MRSRSAAILSSFSPLVLSNSSNLPARISFRWSSCQYASSAAATLWKIPVVVAGCTGAAGISSALWRGFSPNQLSLFYYPALKLRVDASSPYRDLPGENVVSLDVNKYQSRSVVSFFRGWVGTSWKIFTQWEETSVRIPRLQVHAPGCRFTRWSMDLFPQFESVDVASVWTACNLKNNLIPFDLWSSTVTSSPTLILHLYIRAGDRRNPCTHLRRSVSQRTLIQSRSSSNIAGYSQHLESKCRYHESHHCVASPGDLITGSEQEGFVATLLIAGAWVLTRRHLSDWQGAAAIL